MILRALPRARSPAAVSATLRVVRHTRRVPNASSRAAMFRDTAVWDIRSAMPASVNVPCSTIAIRQRNWRSSTSMPLIIFMHAAHKYLGLRI